MKFSLPLIFIIVNFIFSTSSNNRLGAGLDIGSKGSGIFFNYLSGNNKKNFDFVGEIRYFDIKGETETIVRDPFTYELTTIGGQNLLFIPVLVGFNYHPYSSDHYCQGSNKKSI